MIFKRLFSVLLKVGVYTGFTVLLAIELLQAKRESAIDKSKILTDSAKDKLCSLSITAESLFGGQVAEI